MYQFHHAAYVIVHFLTIHRLKNCVGMASNAGIQEGDLNNTVNINVIVHWKQWMTYVDTAKLLLGQLEQ